jgi:hypothetical protein
MEQKLARQIKVLQVYAGVLTLALVALAALYLRQTNGTPHFKQIDAERINIVEQDGQLRMVISNQKLQHPGRINGKDIAPRRRDAGFIYFNDDGDECGGMTFHGNKQEADMSYSLDQYKNDQIMQLQYSQAAGAQARTYGLKLWDRSDDFNLGDLIRADDSLQRLHDTAISHAFFRKQQAEGHLGTQRLFLGKDTNKEVGLFLRDTKGTVRLRIGLDSLNHVFFQAFDEKGNPAPLNPPGR